MTFFESLVNQYLGRTPPHFDAIAARLRDGQSALGIRRQLEDDLDLSRFKAGKVVEDVEKAIQAWRISLGTGIGILIVVLALVSPYHPIFWLGLVVGAAQTVAGMRGMHQYQYAVDPSLPDTKREEGSSSDSAER